MYKKILLLVALAIFLASLTSAIMDCPFEEENDAYPGKCGLYLDRDNDNICDYSQEEKNTSNSANSIQNTTQVNKSHTQEITGNKKNYNLIPITLFLFAFYLITFTLSRKKIIRITGHRKFWNLSLLLTFLLSGLSGILLIIQINSGVHVPFNLLYWHVETGIAMFIISLFHISWHWKYFAKVLKLQ